MIHKFFLSRGNVINSCRVEIKRSFKVYSSNKCKDTPEVLWGVLSDKY